MACRRFGKGYTTIEGTSVDATNRVNKLSCKQVKAFSKRAVLPDRILGEFSLTLAHPGATANLSGDLAKKGGSNGTVSFKIRPKSSKAASKHG